MKKFKVGKYYTPATVPSIEPLECVSSTDFYVTFRDSEKGEYIKVKKGGGKMRITQEKMDAIAVLMDDETREKVHHELAPCEPIEFLKRYCELEPSFEAVLKDEFSIEI